MMAITEANWSGQNVIILSLPALYVHAKIISSKLTVITEQ